MGGPVYEISKEFSFSAAHQIRMHGGKCERLHGHNWKIRVYARSSELNRIGMVIDFADLKALVKRHVVDRYDHALVLHASERAAIPTDHPLFARTHFTPWQPTCEHLLLDMVARIRAALPPDATLHRARLQETATSWAEWGA